MTQITQLDDRLKSYATARQGEYIDAVNEHGGIRAAARVLGVDGSTISRAIKSAMTKAAAQGFAPEAGLNSPVPDPFVARGHSTLERIEHAERVDPVTGERRKPILQWTKTALDDQKWAEAVKAGIAAFLEDTPKLPVAPPLRDYDHDLIPWIQIGDGHLGQLCHAAETNENFDLKIAEHELFCAIGALIDELPPVERLVINDLGDFTHYENFKGETEHSGHKLDFDTRFPKMIRVYSRLMRAIVEKALTKARHVDVIVNQGNHSRTNDIWMAELLDVAFGHTDRVHVLNNGNVFIGYRMGNTFVMTHHSDKCKPKDLIGVMISDYREDFGETEHHYIDIGHIHHQMVVKEYPSVFVESFNNLAPNDKHHHDAGYRSRRSIMMILRSRTYGEVGRRVLPIQEVRDKLLGLAPGTAKPSKKEAYRV